MTILEPHPIGVPVPVPSATSQPFWDGCNDDRLMYQRCGACGRALFNPTPMCRQCGSRELTWEQSSGAGTVYSYSAVTRSAGPGYRTPYVVAIVDLDEGYQILTNIVGCDHDDVFVGQQVDVEFHQIAENFKLHYFRPRN